jgi:hypothetical protein
LGYKSELVQPPPGDAQWARWNLDFCDAIQPLALAEEEFRWIVIDGFNNVLLPQATIDLVKELSIRISGPLIHLRLVLIGYDDTLSYKISPMLKEETIAPIEIRDVLGFFARCGELKLLPANFDLELATERVCKGLDPRDVDFLKTLQSRVSDALEDYNNVLMGWGH